MGGGSKKQTVGYKYYLGEHMVLCHGPIDYITQIEVDEKVLYAGEFTGGSLTIDQENLFGGESREGGIKGTLNILMGTTAQVQNDYLVAQLGADVPAYRGVVSAVLRQMYLGINPYLKPWAFRGQRIHKRGSEGATQWYDAVSEIVSNSADLTEDFLDNFTGLSWLLPCGASLSTNICASPAVVNDSAVMTGENGVVYKTSFRIRGVVELNGYTGGTATNSPYAVKGATGFTSLVNQYKLVVSNPAATYYLNKGAFTTSNCTALDYVLTIPVAGGATVQLIADSIDSAQVKNSTTLSTTDDDPTKPLVVTQPYDGQFLQCDAFAIGTASDMNPAHIIRECLTDPDWGMGYADSDIDDTSFTASADTLYAEGMGMSLLWDRQMAIEDFIGEVVRHIDAALYVSRTTGKFVLKMIRDDYDEGALITLDESNIAKVTNPKRPTFGELYNSVTVAFWNSGTGNDDSITITDTAMAQVQGVIGTTVQYPGFTSLTNAAIAAQRDLRALSSQFLSCTIYCDATAKDLNIGDVFKFTWARWQVNEMVMRVTGLAFGDGKSNQVRITCAQDVFSTPLAPVIKTSGSEWVNPSQPPAVLTATEQIAVEAPYYEVVQQLSQLDTDNILTDNPEIGYVVGAAKKPTAGITARLWTNDGSAYQDVSALEFCPYATVKTAAWYTDTTIYMENVSQLDLVTVGGHLQIGQGAQAEICRIDAIDTVANTVTVGRGCLDTTPKKHLAGEPIFFWDLYNGFDPTDYLLGETIYAKITPASGTGQSNLADVVEQSVVMEQRAWKPYAPGQFKINGSLYPTTPDVFSGSLTFTWVDRDRVQQTSGTIYDHTAAAIGPEAGTTYRLRVWCDGVLVSTIEPAVSGEVVSPSPGGTTMVEVHSKRDGVYSFQGAAFTFEYAPSNARATEDGTSNDIRSTMDGSVRVTED